MKSCPSAPGPRNGTKRSPGRMLRVSVLTPVTTPVTGNREPGTATTFPPVAWRIWSRVSFISRTGASRSEARGLQLPEGLSGNHSIIKRMLDTIDLLIRFMTFPGNDDHVARLCKLHRTKDCFPPIRFHLDLSGPFPVPRSRFSDSSQDLFYNRFGLLGSW